MSPENAEQTPRWTVSDRVFGAVAAVALLAALWFALAGGEEDDGARPVAPPPPITVVEPRDGAEVAPPVAVVFDPGSRMRRDASGWVAAGRYHLHAMIDGVELMAAPHEIQPLEGTRYRWVLPLAPGEHRLRLQWSGPDHRTLAEGGSPPLVVRVRGGRP